MFIFALSLQKKACNLKNTQDLANYKSNINVTQIAAKDDVGPRIRTFSLEGRKGIEIIAAGIGRKLYHWYPLLLTLVSAIYHRISTVCTHLPTQQPCTKVWLKLVPLNIFSIPEPQLAHYLYLELAKCCNGTFIDQVLFAFFIMTRDTIKHARHGRMLFSDKIAKLQSRVRSFTNFYCASFLFITL